MLNKKVSSKSFPTKAQMVSMFAMLLITAMILAACQSATPTTAEIATAEPNETEEPVDTEEPNPTEISPQVIPSVFAEDQAIVKGSVTISEVISNGPGWLVIHAQADGKPGPILGYSQVADGANKDVVVEIETTTASETLYAMLHSDAGEVGQWEFPDGPDAPVKVDDQVITPPFKVLAAMMPEVNEALVLSLSSSDDLGEYLVDSDGMTLYLFTRDEENVTNCYDQCAEAWPPLMLSEGQTIKGAEDLTGEFGTTERKDGELQVTYNGMPLYYWFKDTAPGDTTGHGVNGVWAVVSPQTIPFKIVPDESKVSYEVGEVFLDDNQFALAVGVTRGIEGKVYIDLSNPLATLIGPINIDVSQFTSDSNRRDNKIRSDFLESSAYPIARFVPTSINGLPETYNEGDLLTLQITGELTVKEVTKEVTFDATVQVLGNELSGSAGTTILMSDFGVGPISLLGILETEDEVKLNFEFVARP